MIFVYIIPVYVILAAILIAIGGIYHIVTEMYVLLFTITTFLTVIGGIYTFFVSISKAVSTKRVCRSDGSRVSAWKPWVP